MAKRPTSTASRLPGLSQEARYWKVRLDHTLQHTQQSTRLIYIINGGVAAALYFIASKSEVWPWHREAETYLLLALGGLNIMHAALISVQGLWYRKLDERFAKSVGVTDPVLLNLFGIGTHRIYASIHFLLGLALLYAAIRVSTL